MEFAKFAPSLKTLLLRGISRNELWPKVTDYDVVITSYALMKRDIQKHSSIKYDLIILDEAQHIKNPDTANSIICRKINAKAKVVLTGTPIENNIGELWTILDFLHPGILGSYPVFKKKYNLRDFDETALNNLSTRISPIILRRRKNDVLSQLPPKTEQNIFCDMEEEQESFYKKMLENAKQKCREIMDTRTSGGRIEILTLLLRLRQFCCHPALLPKEFGVANLASAKTELLKELILESADSFQKTLVFSQFPSLLKIVSKWLADKNIKFEYLDGATPAADRMRRVENFNSDPSIVIFLLSIKAGGFGFNLTSADKVIIYDPWWNPAVETQASDRAHRIGQHKAVSVYKLLVNNTIEEKILRLQDTKKKLSDGVIEKTPSVFTKLTDEDIMRLFS
jgi:non-specific serine/threonine protein kinase